MAGYVVFPADPARDETIVFLSHRLWTLPNLARLSIRISKTSSTHGTLARGLPPEECIGRLASIIRMNVGFGFPRLMDASSLAWSSSV